MMWWVRYKAMESLSKQAVRINRLIQTVDNTINHLKGNKTMSDENYLKDSAKNSRKNMLKKLRKCTTLKPCRRIQPQMEGLFCDERSYYGWKEAPFTRTWSQSCPRAWAASAEPLSNAGTSTWTISGREFGAAKSICQRIYWWSALQSQLRQDGPHLAEFMRNAVKVYVEVKSN